MLKRVKTHCYAADFSEFHADNLVQPDQLISLHPDSIVYALYENKNKLCVVLDAEGCLISVATWNLE